MNEPAAEVLAKGTASLSFASKPSQSSPGFEAAALGTCEMLANGTTGWSGAAWSRDGRARLSHACLNPAPPNAATHNAQSTSDAGDSPSVCAHADSRRRTLLCDDGDAAKLLFERADCSVDSGAGAGVGVLVDKGCTRPVCAGMATGEVARGAVVPSVERLCVGSVHTAIVSAAAALCNAHGCTASPTPADRASALAKPEVNPGLRKL